MSRRQDPAVRPDRAASAAAVARQPLGVAARLVAGQIGDRATPGGRVQVAPADLAACCCLRITVVADALADLAGRGLLGRDGEALVLTVSAAGGWS